MEGSYGSEVEIHRSADGLRGQTLELGIPIEELGRKYGVSVQTLYRWKNKYGGLSASEVRRLKQLEEENRKLKQLVADLSLDKQILQDVLRKKF